MSSPVRRVSRSRRALAYLSLCLVTSGVPRPATAAADPPTERFIEIGVRDAAVEQTDEQKQAPATLAVDPPGLTRAMEPDGQGYVSEVEPNNTAATATPLATTDLVLRAPLWPVNDVDFFSFTANAGDRVYAATVTNSSTGSTEDSVLTLFAPDGTTVLETDNDNGQTGTTSSSIAGTTLLASGVHFLRVTTNTAGNSMRSYEVHLRVQSGAPTPEVEPNDTTPAATPLPPNGWVSGTRANGDLDRFSLTLNAGDTVWASLDLDPERDNVQWNGRLGIGLFGEPTPTVFVQVDDGGATGPNSEAFMATVTQAGTYFVSVDSATAGQTGTYHLSVSVHPPADEGVNCTIYPSGTVGFPIGPNPGAVVSSTINVPDSRRIADVDVILDLTHAALADLDIQLRSPAGNDNGLVSDMATAAGQADFGIIIDDEAAFIGNLALSGLAIKPLNSGSGAPNANRLSWFDGENSQGNWTLDIRDDANGGAGTLNSWALRICEAPPPPSCPAGFAQTTVFSTDFEGGPAGFTHAGTADEWELGLPATVANGTIPLAAFNTCNSGSNCWKTDLDNTYENSATNDLLSPSINLTGFAPPVIVSWAQRYQMERATFDLFNVDLRQNGGGPTSVRLFEWLDSNQQTSVGSPAVAIGGSSGWSVFSRRADSMAGLDSQFQVHMQTDTSVVFGGIAIDDVSVTACAPANADLSITKTDGVTSVTAGGSTTYTITASNAGPDAASPATVADTFPGNINCPSWTCVGAGGGTCTPSGSGSINDTTVNLPAGGSVTYTASCSIGTNINPGDQVVNTATVSSATPDPTPGNNSATDTDTVVFSTDLAITKTDGVTTATPGGSVTYTITASNSGPSNSIGATVADTFPPDLTCTWTCIPGPASTCTAAGAGSINDTVDISSFDSVTYTASCNVSASATGTLSNTATVGGGSGTDPVPGNNSATDSDTLVADNDLAITKTDGVTSVTAGGSTTYTITASNAGPSNVTGATVADTFPASLTCTWTCTGAGGGTCTPSGSSTISDTVNLPAGGSVTYTAPCDVSGSASGTVANTATVSATGDPNPGNNSATDTDTVTRRADIAVAKTVDNPTPTVGSNVTYTVTATNNGPADTTGVVVTDVLPTGLTFVSATASQGSYTPATGAWSVGSLTDGTSATLGITATVTRSETIVNQATRTGGDDTDPNRANNTAAVSINGATLADVQVQETADNLTPTNGQNVTFTVTAHNAGPGNATGVVIEDNLPAGLTFVSATPSQGTYASGTGVWTVGAINNGATATLQVVMTVTTTLPTTRAVAKVAQVEPDVEVSNDSDSVTLNDAGSADLALSMVASQEPVSLGTTFSYTIVVANHGPNTATNVTVIDSLPAGLTFVSAQATQGSCAFTTSLICPLGTLPDGGNASITLVVTKTVGGSVSNSASVSATEPDPFMNNNTNGETTTPVSLIDFKVQ